MPCKPLAHVDGILLYSNRTITIYLFIEMIKDFFLNCNLNIHVWEAILKRTAYDMVLCIKTQSKIEKRNGIAQPHLYTFFYVLSRYIKIVNCDNNMYRWRKEFQ